MECIFCGAEMLNGDFAVQSSPSRFAVFGASWDALCFRAAQDDAPTGVVLDSGYIVKGFHCPQCGSSLLHGGGKSVLSNIFGPHSGQDGG